MISQQLIPNAYYGVLLLGFLSHYFIRNELNYCQMKKKFTTLILKYCTILSLTIIGTIPIMAQYNIGGASEATGTITNDDEACSGETVTIAAGIIGGSETYTWSDGSIPNSQTFDRSFTSNETFTVTITDGGDTEVQTINVAVNALPTPNITPSETTGTANDGIICSGDNVTLDSNVAGATAYAWSDGGGSGQTAAYTNITSNTTYTVTVTNSDGCTGTDEFEVTVDIPTGVAVTFIEDIGTPNDGVICPGTSLIASAPSGFASYKWAPFIITTQTIELSAVSPTVLTLSVTVTTGNGCTASAENALTSSAPPTASISVTETSGLSDNDGILCSGDAAILDAGSHSSYLWSQGNTTTQTISVTATGDYTVTVTNSAGCTDTSEQGITVNPLPTASISVTETSGDTDNDGELCSGDAAILDAGSHSSYLWSQGNATTQTISVSATGDYTVTVTDSNGCTDTSEQGVTVHPLPTASISVTETSGDTDNDGELCSGDAAILDAGSHSSYLWSQGNATTQNHQRERDR